MDDGSGTPLYVFLYLFPYMSYRRLLLFCYFLLSPYVVVWIAVISYVCLYIYHVVCMLYICLSLYMGFVYDMGYVYTAIQGSLYGISFCFLLYVSIYKDNHSSHFPGAKAITFPFLSFYPSLIPSSGMAISRRYVMRRRVRFAAKLFVCSGVLVRTGVLFSVRRVFPYGIYIERAGNFPSGRFL